MPITPTQMAQIMRDRPLDVVRRSPGWVCYYQERRVRVDPQPTPELAVEVAEAELKRRESLASERRARRILDAQQAGTHYHVPRVREETDPETGETTTVTEYDILLADGTPTAITGRRSVAEAWRDLRAGGG